MDFFNIGPMELLVVLVIALIFLGPAKLGEAGRYMGKAMKELKKATSDLPKMVMEEENRKKDTVVESPTESVGYQKQASDGELKPNEQKDTPTEEDLP